MFDHIVFSQKHIVSTVSAHFYVRVGRKDIHPPTNILKINNKEIKKKMILIFMASDYHFSIFKLVLKMANKT